MKTCPQRKNSLSCEKKKAQVYGLGFLRRFDKQYASTSYHSSRPIFTQGNCMFSLIYSKSFSRVWKTKTRADDPGQCKECYPQEVVTFRIAFFAIKCKEAVHV